MSLSNSEETIFAEALRLAPDQRPAYLHLATDGDAGLRQRIERLLNDFEAGDFLEQPAAAELRRIIAVSVPITERLGDRIGRYKLLQKVGEGGCGIVYMAEQEEPVRRRVALKIIKLGMDTNQVIARFEAERQALALMDHPNIAKVLDAGSTDTGRPYFVMELVRGMKITDYCDKAKLSIRARLDLFVQVCHAVQHAHQKGIIHRDLKPSNILVSVDNGVAVPKVIDFGIAKATGGVQLTDKTIFTAFEQFIGTPAYMSPEQAMLTNVDVDTRSDIYALGVLLYEVLTGKTPFETKELLAIGLVEMRRTICEQEPERPSTRLSTLPDNELSTTAQRRGIDAPKLMGQLRGDLDWIVMKCLEKDRGRRYETANGLAADIQHHLRNEPVVACPPSRAYRFQKLVQRNKVAICAVTAVAAALIIGLGVSTWLLFQEKAARRRADAAEQTQATLRQQAQDQQKKAETEAAKSKQVAQFLQDMLKGVGPSVALGRDIKLLKEILDKTAERLDKDLQNQPEVQAHLRSTLGEVYLDIGDGRTAEKMIREALAAQQKVLGHDNLSVARSLYYLSKTEGSVSNAETDLRQALGIYKKLLGPEDPDTALALGQLAWTMMLGDFDRATEVECLARESVAIMRKTAGHESEKADAIYRLGVVFLNMEKHAEAQALFEEALAIRKKLPGDQRLGIATLQQSIGVACYAEEKYAEAEPAIRGALAVYRDIFPPGHPRLANQLCALGVVLRHEGKLAEAESMLRECLAIRKKTLSDDNQFIRDAQRQLAVVLFREGKTQEAETFARAAVELLRKNATDAAGMALFARFLSSFEMSSVRDGKLAVQLAEKAVAMTNRKEPRCLDAMAAADAETGNFESAIAAEKEAIAVQQNAFYQNEYRDRLKLYQSKRPYRDLNQK